MTSITIDRRDGLSSSTAIKGPCRAATTANIALYGEQTIDGVAVVTGDRVLVKDQTASVQNGIYVVDTGGWRRPADFRGNRDVVRGTLVFVTDGDIGIGEYQVTSDNPIVIDQTAIEFELVSDTVFGEHLSVPALYSRVVDSINILDYATSKAQRTGIKSGSIGFKGVLDEAIEDATERGIKLINLPDGNLELDDDSLINNPGVFIQGVPSGTYLHKNGTGRMFQTLGTVPNITAAPALTADAAAGALSISLSPSDAAQFAAGQTAILRSTLTSKGDGIRDAEFVYITVVNTGTGVINVAAPLYFAYTTANTAKLIPAPLVSGVGYGDLIVDWTDATKTSPQRPPYNVDEVFTAWFCDAPQFKNIASKKTFNPTINLHGTINANILGIRGKDGYSDGTDMTDAYSYLIAENGLNVGTLASDIQAERMRHAYTTGGADSVDPTMFNGGHPMFSVISNGIHRNAKEAGWDTHGVGLGITFDNLHTIGGRRSGFQLRTTDMRMNDCSARDISLAVFNDPAGHGIYAVGGDASSLWGRDIKIDNFTAINCAGAGIQHQSKGDMVLSGRLHIEKTNEPAIVANNSAGGNLMLNANSFFKDVAKAPSGGRTYAVLVGHANQTYSAIRDVEVQDPNDNITAVVYRDDPATSLDIRDVRGRSSSGGRIRTFAALTNSGGIAVFPTPASLISTATSGNVGTGEDDLSSLTLPAGAIYRAGTGVRITAWGLTANNANAKTVRLYWGSQAAITTVMPVSVAGEWRIVVDVIYNVAGAQKISAQLSTVTSAGVATVDVERISGTQTDTNTIVVKCTGTATADNDIQQTGMIIDYIG